MEPDSKPNPEARLTLQVKNLNKTFSFARTQVEVLKNLSLSIQAGEIIAIIGASGAGKSTLLHIIGGLDHPTSGSVIFEGQDIYKISSKKRTKLRSRQIGFLFQFYHLLPELDVLENIMLPAMNQGLLATYQEKKSSCANKAEKRIHNKHTIKDKAMILLKLIGLAHRAKHMPTELSGGEQQRAALARALMNQPDLLLADEPTGNLDSVTGETVLQSMFELSREKGSTLILATHNQKVASRCDRVLRLEDGNLALC